MHRDKRARCQCRIYRCCSTRGWRGAPSARRSGFRCAIRGWLPHILRYIHISVAVCLGGCGAPILRRRLVRRTRAWASPAPGAADSADSALSPPFSYSSLPASISRLTPPRAAPLLSTLPSRRPRHPLIAAVLASNPAHPNPARPGCRLAHCKTMTLDTEGQGVREPNTQF
ncbi:hypothetical protein B0H14DRAFT_3075339 [Mycena olivaceomarginata]|nr:hypothetical protein B0H14DRAFT_3075339 [Mycena olivaceomarginata]